MITIDGTLHCPKCKDVLHFDLGMRLYECKNCNILWSFNLQGNEMVWREWKEVPKDSKIYKFVMETIKED